MITNAACYFYELKIANEELFPGTFKPHPLWLLPDRLALLFFVEHGLPSAVTFDCLHDVFEEPRRMDFSLLKVPTFDFSIQRVFLFQGRLLLVKNTLQSDKNLLLLSNAAFNKLYPVHVDLPCDFLHNGVTLADTCLYFFGGVTLDTGRCHARFFRLDLCIMRMTELAFADPAVHPSPRALSFLEVFQDDVFLAGGHPSYPFYEGWKTADDAWFYNLKAQGWKPFNVKPMRLANIRTVARDKNKVCIIHKPKQFEVYTIDLATYSTTHRLPRNTAWVPPGVA